MLSAALAAQALALGLASAQLAPPPPTPVPPAGSLSPFPQALETPAWSLERPDVSAAAAVLADLDTGQVLYARNADARRPIASITKILTALLVLERTRPGEIVTVPAEAVFGEGDRGGVSTLGLVERESVAVDDLLYALMLQSANDAAVALAHHVGGDVERFVRLMNRRAASLGMRDSNFRSPNGLDDRGYSTARDLATLTRAAYRTPGFSEIVAAMFRTVPAPDGPDRQIQNRNVLLWLYPGAIGVKTGYTSEAGFCVVGAAERDGRRLVVVILDAPADAFSDAAALLNHGFAAFTEHTFVQEGVSAGVVDLPGGSVPVVTGSGLEALVPTAAIEDAEHRIVVDPRAAYPPGPLERVASLTFTIPGLTVGAVPLVVSSVPPPPPTGEDPWWRRAGSSVASALDAALEALFA
jgi:D-alanyl-D-alanine carboxypeptidase (penicillin-binding protein 5/6)